MIDAALAIKSKVYNNRIVVFAPLYLSSKCVNSCVYCGFRAENGEMKRRRLTLDEVRREAEALTRDFGHKRLVVVFGEHPDSDVDYMISAIDTIYSVKVQTRKGEANIRRVNVNAAPMSIEKLRRLSEVGMGTFQVFQETYDRRVYSRVHPSRTIKGDFRWRLYCHHRAMEAGVDDVGIGALFGLADWRFEVLGLVSHSRELERRFNGVGAHTISFPRLEPASNAPWLEDKGPSRERRGLPEADHHPPPRRALHRPHLHRARAGPVRNEAVRRGITQMDAGTRIGLGAYSEGTSPAKDRGTGEQDIENQQFLLGDSEEPRGAGRLPGRRRLNHELLHGGLPHRPHGRPHHADVPRLHRGQLLQAQRDTHLPRMGGRLREPGHAREVRTAHRARVRRGQGRSSPPSCPASSPCIRRPSMVAAISSCKEGPFAGKGWLRSRPSLPRYGPDRDQADFRQAAMAASAALAASGL